MELDVKGNPGNNNTYHETNMGDVHTFAPNATTVNNTITTGQSRYASYLKRLQNEILDNVKGDVIEGLLHYNTRLEGTKDLAEKLADGHFTESRIVEATRLKEMYAKTATRFECYPSAQQINLNFFARIKHDFDTYIYPLIEDEAPLRHVMREVREKIVAPIMAIIDNGGEQDRHLQYTEDHIYGMIYYLTGMCHLNWKDYDNV